MKRSKKVFYSGITPILPEVSDRHAIIQTHDVNKHYYG